MKRRILIVEDDQFLAEAYRLQFEEDQDIEVVIAQDGIEGMSHVKEKKPVLVILDLLTPHENGFSFLQSIKDNSETKDIPVIVASNLNSKSDIDKAMDMGADDYFVKSSTTASKLAKICKKFLDKHKDAKS